MMKKTNLLWIMVVLGLLLSACGGDAAPVAEEDASEAIVPAAVLPKEVVSIEGLSLGVASLFGEVVIEDEEFHPGEYRIVLTDAMPVLEDASRENTGIFGAVEMEADGTFRLLLPHHPQAMNQKEQEADAMQVFALTLEPEMCLLQAQNFLSCFTHQYSSVSFTDSAQSVVGGGAVLIWAGDDEQTFPADFGVDGLLFTEDDPQIELQAGYTLVDLNASPFGINRDVEATMPLVSNYDPSTRDLKELSYTGAFDRIFNDMRQGYAFNGVEGKEPDWDAVYELIFPQVQQAEVAEDVNAWISALNVYTQQFSDSHVSISGEAVDAWLEEKLAYGYGFMLFQTPEGNYIRTYYDAEHQRLKYLAEFPYNNYWEDRVTLIDGVPIEEVIKESQPIFGSYSNSEMYYQAQIREITRAEEGDLKVFGVGDWADNQYRKFEAYRDEPVYKRGTGTYIDDIDWPVSYSVLASGVGYVAVRSNTWTETEVLQQFEAALDELSAKGISRILIDLRDNSSDSFLDLAGYFSEESQEIALAEWHQFGRADGILQQKMLMHQPRKQRYSFDRIGVLIGERCGGVCEIEVYTFGLLPQVTLYGASSTYGSVALVSDQGYELPDEIEFHFSIGKLLQQDGSLFIEGAGVQPDILFEKKHSLVLSKTDWQRNLAETYLAYETEMSQTPEFAPTPLLLTEEELDDQIVDLFQKDITYLAVEDYLWPSTGHVFSYNTYVEDPRELFLSAKWCTRKETTLYNAKKGFEVTFTVDGEHIDEKYHLTHVTHHDGYDCWQKLVVLDDWAEGNHQLITEVHVVGKMLISGTYLRLYIDDFYTEEYTVVVKRND